MNGMHGITVSGLHQCRCSIAEPHNATDVNVLTTAPRPLNVAHLAIDLDLAIVL